MEETTAIPTSEKRPTNKPDSYIIGIYITLCLFSLVESFSASSREIKLAGSIYMPMVKHLVYLGIGALFVWLIQKKDYTKLLIPSMFFGVITLLCLIAAMALGQNINGAQRAISIFGFFTLQPAEMSKLAVVFALSFFIAQNLRNKEVTRKGLIWCAVIVGVFGLLLFMQGLTNMLLFMGISFALLIVGGTKWRRFPVIIGVYAILAMLSLGIKSTYDKFHLEDPEKLGTVENVGTQEGKKGVFRSDTWIDRLEEYFKELLGPKPYENEVILENDQKLYSYLAQAHGGVIGQGPGGSRETSRLPLAFSDYVFSIVTEDTGFVGAVFLVFLYFCLLIRAGNIARRCNRAYPALLVMGMAVMIVMQAFFHMAINTGVFPVSGQNLPLISKGGTSIFVISIAFGVMLSVSRSAAQTGSAKTINNEEKEALPESVRAANPTKE